MATHICANIGSGNGLLPVQCQAITCANVNLLSVGSLRRNFSEIYTKTRLQMHFKMVAILFRPQCFNTLCSSDTMWWHRSVSTLAQVMAWCLTAPSHYLNQCWFLINFLRFFVINLGAISQWVAKLLFCIKILKVILFKVSTIFPRGQWVKYV